MTTLEAYNAIIKSAVFRTDGEKIDLPAALIDLCRAINAEPEDDEGTDWYMGEGNEACLCELVVGAYWAMTECHGGQNSDTYAALCALGSIFSPGMSSQPDEEDPEYSAYYCVCEYLVPGCMAETEEE